MGGIHIPAESVYAVPEVKQDLTKEQIEYAGEKIASVRRLRRTSAEFMHATGRSRTTPKPILGGIVTYESGWSPPLGDDTERIADRGPSRPWLRALRRQLLSSLQRRRDPEITRSGSESSLIFFFLSVASPSAAGGKCRRSTTWNTAACSSSMPPVRNASSNPEARRAVHPGIQELSEHVMGRTDRTIPNAPTTAGPTRRTAPSARRR